MVSLTLGLVLFSSSNSKSVFAAEEEKEKEELSSKGFFFEFEEEIVTLLIDLKTISESNIRIPHDSICGRYTSSSNS